MRAMLAGIFMALLLGFGYFCGRKISIEGAPSVASPNFPESTMIYGIHPVIAALRTRRRSIQQLYYKTSVGSDALNPVLELAREIGVPASTKSGEDLQRLAGSRQHQGFVLECGELPKLSLGEWIATAPPHPTLVALDQVEDPQNVGGIVRSAAFLGAAGLLLHRAHRAPLSAAASKASAGVLESYPVIEVGNLAQALTKLKKQGFWVVGAAMDEAAKDYRQLDLPAPRVLVLGSEGKGLRRLTRERCDEIVFVPAVGNVESLNVNVAAALLLSKLMDQGLRAM